MPSPKLQYEPVNDPHQPSREEQDDRKEWTQPSRSVDSKPQYAWVWLKDVKHQNWWGRCKDILTGRGPDIHVAISSGKQGRQKVWPRRDDQAESAATDTPWAKRTAGERYDFRKRKYMRPDTQRGKFQNPKAFRGADGQCWEQYHRWADPKEW